MAGKRGKKRSSASSGGAAAAAAAAAEAAAEEPPGEAATTPPPPPEEASPSEAAESDLHDEDEEEDGEEEHGEEEEQEEEEEEDLLSSLLASGLSDRSVAVEGGGIVYSRLTLTHREIEDITYIATCPDLRHVNLAHNSISTLAPLGDVKCLMTLDCSYNRLTTALDFAPGHWLQVADLSHNAITNLPDLSGFWALTTLRLDFNRIQSLEGVQGCRHLRVLTASNNELRRSDGVQGLPLRTLDLSHNKIETTALLCTLGQLRYLDLSWNRLERLRQLAGMNHLRRISLRANPLADLSEIDGLRALPSLSSVDLRRCPLAEWPFYRVSVLHHLPRLSQLDQQPVADVETVGAQNAFNPRPARRAAVDHAQLSSLRLRRPATLAPAGGGGAPPPWDALVLVGPPGAGKQLLVRGLLERLPAAPLLRGVSHTSRPRRPGESSGAEYVFVSEAEFAELRAGGHLAESSRLFRDQFGLSEAAVARARRAGRVLVTHADLAGALSLQRRLPRVQLVLALPLSEAVHRARLQHKERTDADGRQRRWRRRGPPAGERRPLVAEQLAGEALTPRASRLEPSGGQITRTASLQQACTPQLAALQERRRRASRVTPAAMRRTREVTSLEAVLGVAAAGGTESESTPRQRSTESDSSELESASAADAALAALVAGLAEPSGGGGGAVPPAPAPPPPAAGAADTASSAADGSSVQAVCDPTTASASTVGSASQSAAESAAESTAESAADSAAESAADSAGSSAVPEAGPTVHFTDGGPAADQSDEDQDEDEDEGGEDEEPDDIVVPRVTDSLWSVQRSWLRFPDTDECGGLPTDRLTEIPSYGSFSMMDRWARAGAVPDVLETPPYLGVEERTLWEKAEPCLPVEAMDKRKALHADDRLPAYSEAQVAAILRQRQTYIAYHLEQPGLFLLAVNTDRLDEALRQLCRQLAERLPLRPAAAAEPRWAWMERLLRARPVVSQQAAEQLRRQLRSMESVASGGPAPAGPDRH